MKLTLIERKSEGPGVESFIFTSPKPISWKAGQYMQYILEHESPDDRGNERWFTISSAPFEKNPMITTRFAAEEGSTFKKKLATLKVGDSIEMGEIYGDFTIEDEKRKVVFIAGGIGITPFHSILKQADHDGVKLDVTLLYGNRDENITFKKELESFAKNNPALKINYILWPQIIDASLVKKYAGDLAKPLFYISGPEPMVKSLGEMLKSIGVPETNIKLDDFPGYLDEFAK